MWRHLHGALAKPNASPAQAVVGPTNVVQQRMHRISALTDHPLSTPLTDILQQHWQAELDGVLQHAHVVGVAQLDHLPGTRRQVQGSTDQSMALASRTSPAGHKSYDARCGALCSVLLGPSHCRTAASKRARATGATPSPVTAHHKVLILLHASAPACWPASPHRPHRLDRPKCLQPVDRSAHARTLAPPPHRHPPRAAGPAPCS